MELELSDGDPTAAEPQTTGDGFVAAFRQRYVVTDAGGALAFYVDSTNTRILGVKGGETDLTPSS